MRNILLIKKSLLLIFILFGFSSANAQLIQIGSGTTTTSNYSASPVNIWYRRSVMQFVYTAAELTAAGASTSTPINQLGFFVSTTPNYTIPNYTVKLKHTSATNVASNLGSGGWSTVITAFNYAPVSGGFELLALDNTFLWDGVSSIGVEICWSQVQPNYNASGTIRYYNSTNGFRYSWTDASGNSCGSTPNTRNNNKPQIQMLFADNTNWTGAVSSDWFTVGNWSDGIPTNFINAVIPSGTPNNPILVGGTGVCKSIDIQSSAQFSIIDNTTLEVSRNWNCDGIFSSNVSTVDFVGSIQAQLTGVSNQRFYNLRNSNENGLTFNTGTYEIQAALYPEGGTIITNDKITLISNALGTGRITEVKSTCVYTLDMDDSYGDGWNGGYLTVLVDGVSIGTFSAAGYGTVSTFEANSGSTITLNYTSASWENENTYSLIDPSSTILFSDGTNPTTGNVYTTVANCGAIDPFVGDITMERYLSISNDEWRELTTPFPGLTLNDWQNDGVIMAGFSGSNYPSFNWNSVYTYNENDANGVKEDGWAVATSISNPLDYQKAHRVYMGTGNFTLTVKGDVNVGDYTIPLDYQNSLPAEVAAASDQKGWNYIGNPYPCTLDWNKIASSDKVNIYDAYWIWNGSAGNYGLYNNTSGVGTNGVDKDIASSQAFWVQANANSPSLTFKENYKNDFDKAFVKSQNTGDYTSIKIRSVNSSFYDEVVLSFNNSALSSFDNYDGKKLFSPLPQAPSLFMKIANADLAINAIPFTEEVHIPLYANVGVSGNYILTCPNHFQTDELNCLFIEDLQTNTNMVLDTNLNYPYYQSSSDTNARFIIHYLPKMEITKTDISCFGTEDGQVEVTIAGNQTKTIWYSYQGVIDTISIATNTFSLYQMNGGVFQIGNVTMNAVCEEDFKEVIIEEPALLEIIETIQDASCQGCSDGAIDLNIIGGAGTYVYSIDGIDEGNLSNLETGTYAIVAQDENGCLASNNVTINLDLTMNVSENNNDILIFPNPVSNYFEVQSNKMHFIILRDELGRIVYQSTEPEKRVNVENISNGIYLLELDNQYHSKMVVKH